MIAIIRAPTRTIEQWNMVGARIKILWAEQLVDPPNEYINKIYYNIVTSCFDSLATRHSSKHKNTSSQHWDAPGFNG